MEVNRISLSGPLKIWWCRLSPLARKYDVGKDDAQNNSNSIFERNIPKSSVVGLGGVVGLVQWKHAPAASEIPGSIPVAIMRWRG